MSGALVVPDGGRLVPTELCRGLWGDGHGVVGRAVQSLLLDREGRTT